MNNLVREDFFRTQPGIVSRQWLEVWGLVRWYRKQGADCPEREVLKWLHDPQSNLKLAILRERYSWGSGSPASAALIAADVDMSLKKFSVSYLGGSVYPYRLESFLRWLYVLGCELQEYETEGIYDPELDVYVGGGERYHKPSWRYSPEDYADDFVDPVLVQCGLSPARFWRQRHESFAKFLFKDLGLKKYLKNDETLEAQKAS